MVVGQAPLYLFFQSGQYSCSKIGKITVRSFSLAATACSSPGAIELLLKTSSTLQKYDSLPKRFLFKAIRASSRLPAYCPLTLKKYKFGILSPACQRPVFFGPKTRYFAGTFVSKPLLSLISNVTASDPSC